MRAYTVKACATEECLVKLALIRREKKSQGESSKTVSGKLETTAALAPKMFNSCEKAVGQWMLLMQYKQT